MKTLVSTPTVLRRFAALAGITGLAVLSAHAVPYATDITNSAGTVSFRLNENADNVKIISSNGAITNDLGAQVKGLNVVNLGVAAGHVKVVVTRSAAAGYTQLSDDGFQDQGIYVNKFESPRGVVVDNDPASKSFGRIYVSCSRVGTTVGAYVRTVYDGIYVLNSDHTIALDTGLSPRTAGIPFTGGTETASPFRLTIGKDDHLLYICDWSDATGGIWQTDLDVTTNINVQDVVGDYNMGATTHGSIFAAVIEGTMADSNLRVFTYDEDLTPVRSVWRYDIGNASYPFTGMPTGLGQAMINSTIDMVKGGSSNYLYASQNRSAGTDAPSIRVFTDQGVEVTNSWTASRAYLNNATAADLFRNTVALALSPDGNTLALLRGASFGRVYLVPLTNGVFNFAGTNSFAIAGTASDSHRAITYDAVGNIYVVSANGEWLRAYSKGGSTIVTTGTEGILEVGAPPTTISVTRSVASISEGGSATFNFTRSGDTSSSKVVNYTMSGTATNGVDYSTLSGSVTFAASSTTASVTLNTTDDSISEFSETAILTIDPDGSFGVGSAAATVTILDNDTPEITITPVQTTLLEFTGAKATYTLTRKGLLSALTVNLNYTGAATAGVDFTAPSSIALTAATVNTNLVLAAISDAAYEGNEIFNINVTPSASYVVGTPGTQSGTLIDDELPPGTGLFADSFDTPESYANWVVSYADGGYDSTATFGYDYSLDGIPEAPSSTGGVATRGLKMSVNQYAQSLNGLSASPLNKTFTGDYRLRFDIWMNYNGPLNGGGAGSSEFVTAGIGESAAQAIYTGGTSGSAGFFSLLTPADVVMFSIDGDGGFTDTSIGVADVEAFVAMYSQASDSGVFAAGTAADSRGNFNAYYIPWVGGASAPASQLAAFPGQTGVTDVGSIGFAWHTIAVVKQGTTITWSIDGRLIATINADGIPLANNVFVGYNDQFSSGTPLNREVCFGVIDNVRVESLVAPAQPVITGIQLINNGTQAKITFTAGAGDQPSAFGLVSASSLTSAFNPASANITSPMAGQFEAVTSVGSGSQFFRVSRN